MASNIQDPPVGDSDSDSASQTSTVTYAEHEHWDTFQGKVARLCAELWPGEKFSHAIGKICGGSDNRIVGLVITSLEQAESSATENATTPSTLPPGSHILRILRFSRQSFEHDQALLGLAKQYIAPSGIDVPAIIHFDTSASNALGRPYCVQSRVPGQCLEDVWVYLNALQREQIAF
jgi:hypothetical protein